MIRQSVRVVNSTGLHARPAATLARIVKKYTSSLTLVNEGREIQIKGMMSILGAGVKGNTMIDIICNGEDEHELMSELKLLSLRALAKRVIHEINYAPVFWVRFTSATEARLCSLNGFLLSFLTQWLTRFMTLIHFYPGVMI